MQDKHKRCELLDPNKLGEAYLHVDISIGPSIKNYILHMNQLVEYEPFTQGARGVQWVVILANILQTMSATYLQQMV